MEDTQSSNPDLKQEQSATPQGTNDALLADTANTNASSAAVSQGMIVARDSVVTAR